MVTRSDSKHLCNLCGEPCAFGSHPDEPLGLIDAVVQGGEASTPGNGSGALDDLTSYTFSLCEFCLDWVFSQCRIPPEVRVVNADPPEDIEIFRPAEQRVREDEWRTYKSDFFKERDWRNAARGHRGGPRS
jgi:hypothetical protein